MLRKKRKIDSFGVLLSGVAHKHTQALGDYSIENDDYQLGIHKYGEELEKVSQNPEYKMNTAGISQELVQLLANRKCCEDLQIAFGRLSDEEKLQAIDDIMKYSRDNVMPANEFLIDHRVAISLIVSGLAELSRENDGIIDGYTMSADGQSVNVPIKVKISDYIDGNYTNIQQANENVEGKNQGLTRRGAIRRPEQPSVDMQLRKGRNKSPDNDQKRQGIFSISKLIERSQSLSDLSPDSMPNTGHTNKDKKKSNSI
ncbi:MAG: hypothetical protein OEY79_00660 [Anaplasmataceae bacterium]|nr:hypothetical protein [Anaplasmataceae bacterium]